MSSLIEVKVYKQPPTHTVSCDECGEDGDEAMFQFGTNRFCRDHLRQLQRNIEEAMEQV